MNRADSTEAASGDATDQGPVFISDGCYDLNGFDSASDGWAWAGSAWRMDVTDGNGTVLVDDFTITDVASDSTYLSVNGGCVCGLHGQRQQTTTTRARTPTTGACTYSVPAAPTPQQPTTTRLRQATTAAASTRRRTTSRSRGLRRHRTAAKWVVDGGEPRRLHGSCSRRPTTATTGPDLPPHRLLRLQRRRLVRRRLGLGRLVLAYGRDGR